MSTIRVSYEVLPSDEHKRIEQKLRSEAYEALLKLSFSRANQKPRFVERLSKACKGLNDLIIRGKIPKV
jgi:hypothetical protein